MAQGCARWSAMYMQTFVCCCYRRCCTTKHVDKRAATCRHATQAGGQCGGGHGVLPRGGRHLRHLCAGVLQHRSCVQRGGPRRGASDIGFRPPTPASRGLGKCDIKHIRDLCSSGPGRWSRTFANSLQEAIAQYRAALSVAPGYAEAWCNLGVIHKNQVSRQVADSYSSA